MGELNKLSAAQLSGKTPSLYFLKSTPEETTEIANINEADSFIADRLSSGQPIILLGKAFKEPLSKRVSNAFFIQYPFQ